MVGLFFHHEGDGLLDLFDIQVFFGEDKESKLIEIAIKAVIHLVHLNLEDALQGQGQRPEFVLIATNDAAIAQTIRITALVDMLQVLSIHFLDVFARHLINQGVGYVLVLADGSRHLNADALFLVL